MNTVRLVLRRFRRAIRHPDRRLAEREGADEAPPPNSQAGEIESFLSSLDFPEPGRRYLEDHMGRIVRTLTLVPSPGAAGRALELGTYMQMAPTLARVLRYAEVRGAYFGPPGRTVRKASTVAGEEVFHCEVDHFDVERDRFPYEDASFDTVLACEILEHLVMDPMHMLLEIHRVLQDSGAMVLTTPNSTSYTSVARVLTRSANPQVYSQYPNPANPDRETEIPHVREYAPDEVRAAVESAGFEIASLFTEAGPNSDAGWVEPILRRSGYPITFRGEQIYCVARKRTDLPVTRYPGFLYDL
jgi:SAM-dependent methyltransferase